MNPLRIPQNPFILLARTHIQTHTYSHIFAKKKNAEIKIENLRMGAFTIHRFFKCHKYDEEKKQFFVRPHGTTVFKFVFYCDCFF